MIDNRDTFYYNTTIERNIDVVDNAIKECIQLICKSYEYNFNDVLHNYSFSRSQYTYLVSTTEKENHTLLNISCKAKEGVFSMQKIANAQEVTNEFLNILSAKLNNVTPEQMEDVVKKNSSDTPINNSCCAIGCCIVLVILILFCMISTCHS